MVKGVNKTVIEVNNTGSRLFEKIVFYVSPQYSEKNLSELQKAAGEFSFQFSDTGTYTPLRDLHRKKNVKKAVLCSVIAGIAVIIGVCVFFM